MGESLKGGDLEEGGDYPEAVQDARSCYHTMGSLTGVMRMVFWIS